MNEGDDNNTKAKGNVEGTINAVTDLVKEVPIYEDAIQPAAKEAGKALEIVGKAVNAALIPVKGLVWGVEKIEEFVKTKVSEKLRNTPEENIQTPDPAVAGPALESLRYVGHKESLSDLYASLLATSMDSRTAMNAHPGFVEIIRNMSSDEARIIKYLITNDHQPVISIVRYVPSMGGRIIIHKNISAIGNPSGCENISLMPSYFDNLIRLGLIEIPREELKKEGIYDKIINDDGIIDAMKKIDELDDSESKIEKGVIRITELGKLFSNACVIENGKT